MSVPEAMTAVVTHRHRSGTLTWGRPMRGTVRRVVRAQTDDFGFAPEEVGFIADPYPVYDRLRTRAPLHLDEATDHWLVARHEDVNALLRDRRLGRTYHHLATDEEMGRLPADPALQPFWHLIEHGILDMEPPMHTRVRRLVSEAFTPRMVERMRAPIQRLMDGLVDTVQGSGTFDLIPALAEPLPVAVIAELLGIPTGDRGLLRPWSADICRMYELDPSPEDERAAVRACTAFSDYLRALSRERRARPTGDLVSELALVVDDGERLTEDELIGTCVLLLNAGHEATVNAAGNGLLALLRHPEQMARLRGERAPMPTAVEELLRYDSPLQLFRRYVLDDMEYEGVHFLRGEEVCFLYGAANRDEAAFPRAAELDLGRRPNNHLAFGGGKHYCIGAPLARLELELLYRTLFERIPQLELDEPEPPRRPGFVFRGLQRMSLRWS